MYDLKLPTRSYLCFNWVPHIAAAPSFIVYLLNFYLLALLFLYICSLWVQIQLKKQMSRGAGHRPHTNIWWLTPLTYRCPKNVYAVVILLASTLLTTAIVIVIFIFTANRDRNQLYNNNNNYNNNNALNLDSAFRIT